MFITFEGIDASGKTTQCSRIVEKLQEAGHKLYFVREPGGTVISEQIRTILLDKAHNQMDGTTELLLFSAARAQLVREQLLPALERGEIIIADRFYDSTTAYQGYGRGIDLKTIYGIHELAVQGLHADATFFLDIPHEESVRRRVSSGFPDDRIEQMDRTFFTRVRNGYKQIAADEPERFHILDGMLPADSLTLAIIATLKHLFERNGTPWQH